MVWRAKAVRDSVSGIQWFQSLVPLRPKVKDTVGSLDKSKASSEAFAAAARLFGHRGMGGSAM